MIAVSPRLGATLQALLVTVLWATSWVLIKWGLRDMPPLTFAGMRYFLAFVTLVAFTSRPCRRAGDVRLGWSDYLWLSILGVMAYSITQGAQFFSLTRLPANSASLLASFIPVYTAILAAIILREVPRPLQWLGVAVALTGAYLFFPGGFAGGETAGVAAAIVGGVSQAGVTIIVRRYMTGQRLGALQMTKVSMGVGSTALLAVGLLVEPGPRFTWAGIAIIVWMAVANTAFAFTLWNHTLKVLPALESSILANTLVVPIALLAWLFLGETLTPRKILAIFVVLVGVTLVQVGGLARPGAG